MSVFNVPHSLERFCPLPKEYAAHHIHCVQLTWCESRGRDSMSKVCVCGGGGGGGLGVHEVHSLLAIT